MTMQICGMSLSLITLAIALCANVDGAIFLVPNSAKSTVIANKATTLECYTNKAIYSDLSFSFDTPEGRNINRQTFPLHQYQNGGLRRIITFTMTTELNGTKAFCHASGSGVFNSSQPVIILVQVPPNPLNDVRVCKFGCRVFFSWNPVFVLEGIDVSYIINENYPGQNMTINMPHYSLKLNNELEYEGSIVVMFNASAFNQVAYSEPKTIRHQLSDTNLTLDVSSVSLENEDIKYNFTIRLSNLNQCSFNELKDGKLIACVDSNESTCKISPVNVYYQETGGELVFSSTLDSLRQKFNSTLLSFEYFGEEIKTDNVSLSTHLIQNVTFNQRCANFSVLGEKNISLALHFKLKSEKELTYRFSVSKNNSLLCSPILIEHNKTHNFNISISVEVGNWSMYVYDASNEEEPAVELHNVDIRVNTIILSSPERTASSSFASSATNLHAFLAFCLLLWLLM